MALDITQWLNVAVSFLTPADPTLSSFKCHRDQPSLLQRLGFESPSYMFTFRMAIMAVDTVSWYLAESESMALSLGSTAAAHSSSLVALYANHPPLSSSIIANQTALC